jgi:hypothetical protein
MNKKFAYQVGNNKIVKKRGLMLNCFEILAESMRKSFRFFGE